MNDEMLMNDYLMVLKSTMEVYVHGTLESSNDSVRSTLKSCLDDTFKCQQKTYDKMVENEWYTFDNVNPSIICDMLEKVNQN